MPVGHDIGALTWVLSPGALLADSSESDDLWGLAIGPAPGRYCVYQANRACPEEHFLDRYAVLADALDSMPSDLARYVEDHGRSWIEWAEEIQRTAASDSNSPD